PTAPAVLPSLLPLAAPTPPARASGARLIAGRLGDRYVALHGGSSFGSWRIARHAPTRGGRARGAARTPRFHERRDNLHFGGRAHASRAGRHDQVWACGRVGRWTARDMRGRWGFTSTHFARMGPRLACSRAGSAGLGARVESRGAFVAVRGRV